MGAALARYQRVGGRSSTCENCTVPFTWPTNTPMRCARCGALLCRRCYSRGCGQFLPPPLLALARRHAACDACWDDAEREARFASAHMPLLVRGEVLSKVSTSLLLAESVAGVWLTLHASERALRFHTMEMVQQAPKESGEVKLDDIAGLQVGVAAGAGAGVASGGGPKAAYAARHLLRLVNARGHGLLLLAAADDRQLARWSAALAELIVCCRMPHSTLFPRPGGPAEAAAAAAASDKRASAASAAKSAREVELHRRQAEREAFRARLGNVGMTHTARIMLERAAARERGGGEEEGGGGGGTSASTNGEGAGSGRPPRASLPAGATAPRAPSVGTGAPSSSAARAGAGSGGATAAAGAGASVKRVFGDLVSAVSRPPPPGAGDGVGSGGRGGGGGGGRRGSGLQSMPVASSSGGGGSSSGGSGGGGGALAPSLSGLRASVLGGVSAVRTGLGQAVRTVAGDGGGPGGGR
jgi:hypothetical protein